MSVSLGKRCCHIFRLEMAVAADNGIWYEFCWLLRNLLKLSSRTLDGDSQLERCCHIFRLEVAVAEARLYLCEFEVGCQHYFIEYKAADFEREDSREGARDLGDF
jgi:hypothetical protein